MSTSKKPRLWIKTLGVFCSPTTQDEAGSLMRTAVEALMAAAPLKFEDEEDEAIFQREDRSAPEWGDQPIFLRSSASEYSILLGHFWKPEESYHYFTMSPESAIDPGDLPEEWPMLIERTRHLVSALNPDAVFGWARSGKANHPFDFRALCLKKRPYAIAPWTYYDAGIIDSETRSALHSLGSVTEQLTTGLVISPVQMPGVALAADIRTGFDDISSVKYDDPLMVES